jgi:hypothetical protein
VVRFHPIPQTLRPVRFRKLVDELTVVGRDHNDLGGRSGLHGDVAELCSSA